MAKQQKQAAATPAKSIGKTINRKRRNAGERKCLTKAMKVMFLGSSRTVFKFILAAEREYKENRRKQAVAV